MILTFTEADIEALVDQCRDTEGYGKKQCHPPDEDGEPERDDRHPGCGHGKAHRVQRRKADTGRDEDDRNSPAALTQQFQQSIRPGSELGPKPTSRFAGALAAPPYSSHQTRSAAVAEREHDANLCRLSVRRRSRPLS